MRRLPKAWGKRAVLWSHQRLPQVLMIVCLACGTALLWEGSRLPQPSAAQPEPGRPARVARAPEAPPVSRSEQEAQLERVVASMYREADSQRWELAQVTVHRGAATDHSVPRLTLTGKGVYPAVRRALGNVLSKNQDLALDRLAISRRAEEAGRVDVEAEWSVPAAANP